MWTEREKYIDSFDGIREYLQEIDYFHDHRIGNVRYDGAEAKITVEEIIPEKHISESAGSVWDFEIKGIVSFQMDCDCAFTYFLNEVTMDDDELVFNCTNGYISIKAKEIKLGIPTTK